MQLTQYSDYALRILLYLGIHPPEEGQPPPALLDISRAYGISFSHLSKLAQRGFIIAQRGRTGGIRLARPASEINLGEVVRATETNLNLVECFDPEHNTCPIAPVCAQRRPLREALNAFLATLDRYT